MSNPTLRSSFHFAKVCDMGSYNGKSQDARVCEQSHLETLNAAGIKYEKVSNLYYRVEPGFSYWPSTERWRSHDGQAHGYGTTNLIKAVRERT